MTNKQTEETTTIITEEQSSVSSLTLKKNKKLAASSSAAAMLHKFELKSSHEDDDPQSGYEDGDADTSFEIDEPDDEEILDDPKSMETMRLRKNSERSDMMTPTNDADFDGAGAETSSRSLSPTHRKARENSPRMLAPSNVINKSLLHTKSLSLTDGEDTDDPSMDQSEGDGSAQSHTASSTPTTADVAEVLTAITITPRTQIFNVLHASNTSTMPDNLRPVIHGSNIGNGSYTEDNLSASIATTTTDVELENAPSVSTKATIMPRHDVNRKSLSRLEDGIASTTSSASVFPRRDHLHSSLSTTVLPTQTAGVHVAAHRRSQSASSYRSLGATAVHPSQSVPAVQAIHPQSGIYYWLYRIVRLFKSSGIGEPSVYHAVIVIFLEFFAWGLLAMPVISVLNQTFPEHTFLMNGLVMGIKGILSFLSAPLVGALSDIWGRKFFLLITVFFTCAPIPLMTINSWWFFAMISISGVFAVTFSVVFAYVADVTTVEERSRAYGLVSATFAASLVISPALGSVLRDKYSDTLVVALATAIAVLDVFFILVAVPESLPEKMRTMSWGTPISWEHADPFSALRKVGTDRTILMQCFTVLLSYLPEAGQYSCIFVYLKLKMGFNSMEVAVFIAVVGILSICVQVILGYLMRVIGGKRTIILGLILEMVQMLWYGFGSQAWMMWAAGILAAFASITYPAISAFVSLHSTADSQGVVQGIITGMRGLCNGLGPALFGVIFYFFNVDLNVKDGDGNSIDTSGIAAVVQKNSENHSSSSWIPGPPFAIGALMVLLAIVVAAFIPNSHNETILSRVPSEKKRRSSIQYSSLVLQTT